ncbi:MAG: hypothetical protein Q8N98_04220, partial [bacterium]|nr:hypothetical protein [bacterium]
MELIGVILIVLFGSGLVFLINPEMENKERLALGWTIGLGFITQWLFLLSVFNIRYSIPSVLLPLIAGDLFLLFLAIKKTKIRPRFGFLKLQKYSLKHLFGRFSRSEQVLIILLAVLFFGSLIKALFWPVYYWDALAWYDYRAKIFFEAGGIASSMILASIPLHGAPPMTSLAHTFIYILGGENANPQFIYALFYLALL